MSKRIAKNNFSISDFGSWMNVLAFVNIGGEPGVGLGKKPELWRDRSPWAWRHLWDTQWRCYLCSWMCDFGAGESELAEGIHLGVVTCIM